MGQSLFVNYAQELETLARLTHKLQLQSSFKVWWNLSDGFLSLLEHQ